MGKLRNGLDPAYKEMLDWAGEEATTMLELEQKLNRIDLRLRPPNQPHESHHAHKTSWIPQTTLTLFHSPTSTYRSSSVNFRPSLPLNTLSAPPAAVPMEMDSARHLSISERQARFCEGRCAYCGHRRLECPLLPIKIQAHAIVKECDIANPTIINRDQLNTYYLRQAKVQSVAKDS